MNICGIEVYQVELHNIKCIYLSGGRSHASFCAALVRIQWGLGLMSRRDVLGKPVASYA